MKPIIKNTLIGIASFVAFRFYKMYELGASIIIKPLDYSFGRVDWSNLNKGGIPLYVQLEILNPSNTSLKMRGIDGVLKFNDKIISTFISKPFTISAGRSTFNLDFKLILQDTKHARSYRIGERLAREQLKLLSKENQVNTSIIILPMKVIIVQLIEPVIAMVIENPHVVQSNKLMFELMWNSLPSLNSSKLRK